MKFKAGLQRRMWLGTVWPNHLENEHAQTMQEEDPRSLFDLYEEWWQKLIDHPCVDFARGQIELSDTGNYHIQVAVHTTDSKRWSWMAKHLKAHWEPARSWEKVVNYCRKSESRVAKLPDYGTAPESSQSGGQNGSLKKIAIDALKDGKDPQWIAINHPEVFFAHHRAINELYKQVYMAWRGGVNEAEE
jgi:hypothetical protein